MKKALLTLVILAGGLAVTSAKTQGNSNISSDYQFLIYQQDEYREVSMSDLSEMIQSAIKVLAGEEYNITKLEVCDAKSTTRVTLTQKSDGKVVVFILDKDGKVVQDEKNKKEQL